MNCPTVRSKGFGLTVAMGLVLAVAAPNGGRAEHRIAGHPARVNALPRPAPAMKPLRTGIVVAAPVVQALPRAAPSAPPPAVAMGHAQDTGHAGDHGHDRPRGPRIIVVGVPSVYYDDAPGYDGGQYALGDNGVAYCRSYSSDDPPTIGTYIGGDGKAHPCP